MKINLTKSVMPSLVKKQSLEFIIDHKAEREYNLTRLEVFGSITELASGLHKYDFLCQMPSWDPYGEIDDEIAQGEMDELLNELECRVLFREFEEYYVYSRYKSPYGKTFANGIKAYRDGVDKGNCPYRRETFRNIWAEGWGYAETCHEDAISSIKFWGQGNTAYFMNKYELKLKIAC